MFDPVEALLFYRSNQFAIAQQGSGGVAVKRVQAKNVHNR
jgi:hypothetical protein